MESKETLGRILGALHRSARNYFHREFTKSGLGGATHAFLMALYHEDGVTQNDLTTRLNFDKAHTTRAIQKLIDLEYITRERDPNDHRAYRIFLTEKGKSMQPEIKQILLEWSDIISNGLSDKEVEILVELLGRMIKNAQEFVKHGK